ncbi:DUF4269 domain-containing protein [Paenibacillus sp. YN15]|uniref:DUF4269 domain-containing protein n=1 Tax=Paenibacillus sp. YN15 TaxID=1742774 RepID=UPI000DCBAC95|nr:DUF4269 domain-containing protein [Paenibacillus sp. YN15]RAU93196.1 DUF4269 domain-containing protein [Paenibacillus sp. YN15]
MSSREQDFLRGIAYLALGNARQQEACRALRKLRMMEELEQYHPVLVGTVPIDVDIPGSDLDVICQVKEGKQKAFEALLKKVFGGLDGFEYAARVVDGLPRQVGRFRHGGWMVEVFGQPVPVEEQNGYRHMVVEDRLLELLGDGGREAIRRLKLQGLKTESAFARLLQLEGDPYLKLLEMYNWTPEQLEELVRGREWRSPV